MKYENILRFAVIAFICAFLFIVLYQAYPPNKIVSIDGTNFRATRGNLDTIFNLMEKKNMTTAIVCNLEAETNNCVKINSFIKK